MAIAQCAGNLEQLFELFEQDCQAILQSWSRRLVYLFDQDCKRGRNNANSNLAILVSKKVKLVGEQVGQVREMTKRTKIANPRGSIYTTIMELSSQNHIKDGLLGPNSIMVVYMEPLGILHGRFPTTLF